MVEHVFIGGHWPEYSVFIVIEITIIIEVVTLGAVAVVLVVVRTNKPLRCQQSTTSS